MSIEYDDGYNPVETKTVRLIATALEVQEALNSMKSIDTVLVDRSDESSVLGSYDTSGSNSSAIKMNYRITFLSSAFMDLRTDKKMLSVSTSISNSPDEELNICENINLYYISLWSK